MKKALSVVLILALVVTLFAACGRAEEAVEEYETPTFILEPVEPDHPRADIDYWDFIRPLGYLLGGAMWASADQIEIDRLVMWYVLYARDVRDIDITEFAIENEGLFHIPGERLEETVYRYFGIPVGVLRASELYNEEAGVFILAEEIPDLVQSLLLRRVQEAGSEFSILFSVSANQETTYFVTDVILNEDGTFRFVSLLNPDTADRYRGSATNPVADDTVQAESSAQGDDEAPTDDSDNGVDDENDEEDSE